MMSDDGDTKDDVKVPEGEIGEKIEKLFRVEEKDTSQYRLNLYGGDIYPAQLTIVRCYCPHFHG